MTPYMYHICIFVIKENSVKGGGDLVQALMC